MSGQRDRSDGLSVLTAVGDLRALREYADIPVSADDLETVLRAARSTGTERNRQAWAIVVVTDEAQRHDLARCGDFTDALRAAPVGLALVQEPGGYELDTGRLAQNVMLAAATIGLATCPVTLHRDGDARPVLGLGPDQRCRYVVALGHPRPGARPARLGGRRRLDELIHHGRYRRAPD